MAGRKVWAADEILAAADLQSYIQDQVVFVYANASARSSGILAPTEGMVSYLQDTNLLYFFDGSSWVEVAPNVGTAGTYTKVTTDAKGRVTSGTTLSATDLPTVGTAGTYTKVTTDAYGRVSSGTTLSASDIPNLDASKINSGTIAVAVNTAGGVTASTLSATSASLSANLNCAGVDAFALNNLSGNWAVDTSGNARFNGSVTSASTYNQTNTGRAMFVNSSGLFGIGSSSRRFKENIVDADVDVNAVLQIAVKKFNYKKSFDASMPEDIGVIAEELEALGLTDFVYFDDDGVPDGVAYEKLALALIPVVKLQQARLDSFEDRLNKLEKN